MPLAFIVWLETRFLQGIEDVAELMFVGAVLLCCWASLRFSDAQRIKWSSLHCDGSCLKGWCYALKPTSVVRHLLASLAAFFLEIPVMTG